MRLMNVIKIAYLLALFPAMSYAGGGEYFIPSPEGNCGVLSVDGQDDADFINHRGKYLMMVKADELKILNMCNTKQAICYRITAACGDHVHTFIFWRMKK
jgi:hypothetical protein